MNVSTRAKLIALLVVIAAVIGVLIQTAATKAATYYLTVNELYREGQSAIGKEATVSGTIVGSTVRWDPAARVLRFEVRDDPTSRALPVIYHGDRPDDFSNDWPVVVTGRLGADGEFVASKLLIKCPSKYQAKDATNTAAPSA
ncbi:cytochrome c maturation protein CcmE [Alicyclobacillus sp.]|uniref:cytochrome c maturation protein CcmE n=1 Tax=Alicyclobacillus sp. TaxID=61169 RepID=UPI0025BB2889|nr:cytochrome c maturation protein CcmE [Alicyclobacillus sp.]MCL6515810.1 cytochrome c maturation protein CcmE [Alicyclobacillus sp.]